MWRLGFFFHEIAFGLLSVFIPLYVVTPAIGGSLVDVGIMASLALFAAIPASFFWGYVCDKIRSYKLFVLISFLSMTIVLYLFTFATNFVLFLILYVLMSVLHVSHEAPKNVLIAEHYSREEWGKSYALYEGFTEIGWLIGLFLGLLGSTIALGATYTLLLCSGLNLVAFFLAIFFVADPLIIFERRLVSIEKKIDFVYRGSGIASKILDGVSLKEKIKGERFSAFALGIALFSLASTLFLTPLPIFFSQELGLSTSIIFMIYMLNSSGALAGYFLSAKSAMSLESKKHMRRMAFLRGILVLLLVGIVEFAVNSSWLAGIVLIAMGFVYAFYHILTLSLSMELMPAGRSGLFDVLVSLGGASGCFLGPLIAQTLGFLFQFIIASAIFLLAYVSLKFLN